MRFFDREVELDRLQRIEALSEEVSQFTVVSGRRRVGKTSLVQKAYKEKNLLYLFVARKAESQLCETFVETIRETLHLPMLGNVNKFSEIFRFLMEFSKTQHLTVMIDEFQDFYRINPAVYSEMQEIWDSNKDEARINLIVCGSVNSLLNKIFKDKKEPLFGRQTDSLKVRPFPPSVLKEILQEYHADYTKEDLLALYLFTGGVAKYVEMFIDRRNFTKDEMLDTIFEQDSYFLDEGKNILIEEFGKEYGVYFSILSLIATGHNTRGEMEDMLNMEIGGYLKKLIDDYELVQKQQPLFETAANKNVHYAINDNFLRFWFRFIFKYTHIIEAGGIKRLREIVERDYTSYSGRVLEHYFRSLIKEQGEVTCIGYWHDRKGENEIDIITADEIEKKASFFEVKRQHKEINLRTLEEKTKVFLSATKQFNRYKIDYKGLSMEDM